jgi:hypothetical protein
MYFLYVFLFSLIFAIFPSHLFIFGLIILIIFKISMCVISISSPKNKKYFLILRSRDSVVGIATGYVLDGWGVGIRVPVGSRIFSFPSRPDWFWDPPNFISNGYRGSFLGGKAAGV